MPPEPRAQPEKHCPTCGQREEEPIDYNFIGEDVYHCGACGCSWSVSEATKEKVIIDVN